MATTILTPAENRFLQLSQPALQLTELTRVMPLLRDHPTIKDSSDFLSRSTRQLLLDQRVNWLVQGSDVWKLLARLPYAINASDRRADWHHCALCHKPVRYEYHVVLRTDGHEILVGSECVKKFMSDEMQYLMTITTEDNFHAVAQYDDLTAQYPQVPEILWDQKALPHLPQQHRRRQHWVKNGTKTTVTSYLKHRQQTLPETQLSPYLAEYTQLQAVDRQMAERQQVQQQHAVQQQAQLAEKEAAAAWQAADQAQLTAEQQLRASTSYQTYLQAVAALMVQHLPLPQFKQRLRGITMPPALGQLVNSYQLGVMATEFARAGQITATRLQIVPRYLVADLNRFSRQLAAQRQRDWDDDVFNAALGFELTADQRRQRLTQLRDCWEGRQLSDACYATLLRLRESWQQSPVIPATWPEKLRQAFQVRLAEQPATGWVPAKKNHVTPSQLRQLITSQADFATVVAQYHRLYALPTATEAVTLSALHRYYLVKADQRAGRAKATAKLVTELLKETVDD
ncbi:hypothetical protein [Levilactobacillus brevis]|uniref:hypothetical protein n=1 Tax=Levilactobacillus brevis TaxID=1580 RepID=UPI0039E5EF82